MSLVRTHAASTTVCAVCSAFALCPQIVRLVGQVLLATHFIGCFFFWASNTDDRAGSGHWYSDATIATAIADRYVAALYWALTTVRHHAGDVSQHSGRKWCRVLKLQPLVFLACLMFHAAGLRLTINGCRHCRCYATMLPCASEPCCDWIVFALLVGQ